MFLLADGANAITLHKEFQQAIDRILLATAHSTQRTGDEYMFPFHISGYIYVAYYQTSFSIYVYIHKQRR